MVLVAWSTFRSLCPLRHSVLALVLKQNLVPLTTFSFCLISLTLPRPPLNYSGNLSNTCCKFLLHSLFTWLMLCQSTLKLDNQSLPNSYGPSSLHWWCRCATSIILLSRNGTTSPDKFSSWISGSYISIFTVLLFFCYTLRTLMPLCPAPWLLSFDLF